MTAAPGTDDATLEIRVAEAAAVAARAVPGVVRLQPGLWGTVARLTRDLWERVTGRERPDTAGVEVTLGPEATVVEVAIVADGRDRATRVIGAVRRAVAGSVAEATGLVPVVVVHVVEIDLTGL